MPGIKNFSDLQDLQPGARNETVDFLQDYLVQFGYLVVSNETGTFQSESLSPGIPVATRGVFDTPTQEALNSFQKYFGLPVSGFPDEIIFRLMMTPRCGVPDHILDNNFTKAFFSLHKWHNFTVSYAFQEISGDLPLSDIKTAIAQAFDLWSNVTPFKFIESSMLLHPQIIIRFVVGDHGGFPDQAFDGQLKVLAHAFFPPPGALAGDVHFDDAENWSINIPTPAGHFDLVSVAAHEIGHCLGLSHSNIPQALMFPFYSGVHRFLDADDIRRIRMLYGLGWKAVYQQIDPGNGIGGYDLRSPLDKGFAFDFDHSGRQDHLVFFRPAAGAIFILKNDNGNFTPLYRQIDPGNGIGGYDLHSPEDRGFAFDFDHSGKLDHLVFYRPGSGAIFILKNNNGNFSPVYSQVAPGSGIGGFDLRSSLDRGFAFDFDHSGKLDHLVFYRPASGAIFILKNDNGNFSPVYHQVDPGNGIGGYDLKSRFDKAFAFDYDHSGKLDHLAFYRPGSGAIFILKNEGGNFSTVYQQVDPGSGIGGYDLKSTLDDAFAFDYKRNGLLDHLVIYRPAAGAIFIFENIGGVFSTVVEQIDPNDGLGGFDLHSPLDQAFAFDFNGNGNQDHIVFYRPSSGAIFILEQEISMA